jgi:hypothetical protein
LPRFSQRWVWRMSSTRMRHFPEHDILQLMRFFIIFWIVSPLLSVIAIPILIQFVLHVTPPTAWHTLLQYFCTFSLQLLVSKTEINGRRNPLRRPRNNYYPQKTAPASPAATVLGRYSSLAVW